MIDFDYPTDKVRIWNPWARTFSFTPKSKPNGLEHGYVVEQGQFELPLADFFRIFEGMYHEN